MRSEYWWTRWYFSLTHLASVQEQEHDDELMLNVLRCQLTY